MGMDYVAMYLNRDDVKAAIHAKPGFKWSMCANIDYNATDFNVPMMPVWKWLLANSELKMMIYSGDDDIVCATMGSQQFVWDLGLLPPVANIWQPWKDARGQVGGFTTDFGSLPSSKASFVFITVHGAGHMVPATQPARSLEVLGMFLAKSSKSTQQHMSLVI